MKISAAAWKQLLDSIETNAYTASTLDLSDLALNSKNAIELAKALESNNSIKSLDVHGNRIGDAGFKALVSNTALTSLDISHNIIGHPDSKGLATNEALLKLGLEPTYVFNLPGLESLAENKSLTHLNISDNALKDKGAEVLVHILSEGQTALTSLDISSNDLGGAQEAALAQALADSALTTLNIGNNNLHDASVVTLADSLTLISLDLSHNSVLSTGINALAANTTLTSLNLSNIHSSTPEHGLEEFHAMFKAFTALLENTTLTSLDIHSEQMLYTETFYYFRHMTGPWQSVDFKVGLIELLMGNPDFKSAFFNNTTLIDFNIKDAVWDSKHYNPLYDGAGPGLQNPDNLIHKIEIHIADNLSKAQTTLDNSFLENLTDTNHHNHKIDSSAVISNIDVFLESDSSEKNNEIIHSNELNSMQAEIFSPAASHHSVLDSFNFTIDTVHF